MIELLKPNLSLALAVALAFAMLGAAPGGRQESAQLPANPADLVRKVVENELKTSSSGTGNFFSWKERSIQPNRITVKQFVATPDGSLGRLVSINDKPLSDDDQHKEEARINRLLDPKQMQQQRKQQQDDEARSKKLVSSLPDAFVYKYARTEEKNGRVMVKLKFTPNPNFSPPSRETLVFQAMEGDMVIDSTVARLALIDGTMVRDVSIGWGIIGHLDKGGRFVVEQAEVQPGDWEVTRMQLNFTGKALIFKSIRIDETDISFDFRKVPRMTVAQALDYLKKTGEPSEALADE